MKTTRYYAIAGTANGRIGMLLVTKSTGRPSSQEWTGEEFDDQPTAEQAMNEKNAALFGDAR
jgi:hypothetical protein